MATGEGLEPPWAVKPADLETAAIAAMRTGNNLGDPYNAIILYQNRFNVCTL